MKYFHVMNRQLDGLDDSSPRWSQMYAGSMIGGQQVHGLVISATVAVYNKTAIDESQVTSGVKPLLGVVGTDIPVESLLKKFIKPHMLSPNAYSFLVTKYGYVTIHPEFKLKYRNELRKNYRSISITAIENLTKA